MITARDRAAAMAQLVAWFSARGHRPSPFQRIVWKHWLAGTSGLLHTPTGSGKTLAVFGGALLDALANAAGSSRSTVRSETSTSSTSITRKRNGASRHLKILWITPLKSLAADTTRALREPIEALGIDWQVGIRTGDASARDKRLARAGKLDVLVTTPESLALLLSYPDTALMLSRIEGVIVDEWHELLGNKRGVLLQLGLARLRALAPALRTWGLSATLGNLNEAREALLPNDTQAVIVAGVPPRRLILETIRPRDDERFPWAGHLGLKQLPKVLEKIAAVRSTLVFTNTRAQAELWHQALMSVWPEDPLTLALHHGSLSPKLRAHAEQGLRDGSLRCVVATSSLDLGVDFPAVDQVLQIGSPKGIARLLQRAGRARHRPGEAGHLIGVPTHALELVEYAAARRAISAGKIEPRHAPRMSLDVLAQHCVTIALGGGFESAGLLSEVRGTQAFAALDDQTWQQVLDFIVRGGSALERYPDYCRVIVDDEGIYRVVDRRIALRHRLSIGTITSDGAIAVKFLRGGGLGSVEESFVGRLRKGDRFQFAGRLLELVRLENMIAHVRLAKSGEGAVPKWMGGRMPLSSELGREVEAVFGGDHDEPELRAIAPLLALQQRLSELPAPGVLLVEWVQARDGRHLFLYPFAGRQVHEGLAALLSLRWGRMQPNSFSFAANDYGLVLSPVVATDLDEATIGSLLSSTHLREDLEASLNLAELARRQFRDIARVAGLLPPSLPGRTPRSMRQLQASSGLIYDVLRQYDPGHMLLAQAERELFEGPLELDRLAATLADCSERALHLLLPTSLTPLSFPLWAESLRGQLSTEDWKTRVQRAAAQLERRHGG